MSGLSAVGFGRNTPKAYELDAGILEEHRWRLHQHQKAGVFPGMAECISVDGHVVYLDNLGYADKEHRIPMTERTLFRGNSMMKPITATAFMTLVEEGLVGLDDPVAQYIPKFSFLKVKRKNGNGVEPLKRKMTMRHLLMHTSGLSYGPGTVDAGHRVVARTTGEKILRDISIRQENGDIDTLEKLCDALSERPLLFQPGSAYEYSLSFDVLGRVMEVITGEPIREIIQKRVLTPTGMKDTTWDVTRAAAKQICGYYRLMRTPGSSKRWVQRLDGTRPEASAYARGSSAHYGRQMPTAGGVWGVYRTGLLFSMRDVMLFCQMLLNEGRSISGCRVLKAATVRSLQRNWFKMKRSVDKPIPTGWGSETVGWSPLGHVQLVGPHAGAMFMGGMSYWWMDPRRKIIAAIMTETYWQVQPIGWKPELDNLEKAIEHAVEAAKNKKRSLKAELKTPELDNLEKAIEHAVEAAKNKKRSLKDDDEKDTSKRRKKS